MSDTFAIMMCNVCGRTEQYSPYLTEEMIKQMPKAVIEDVKVYFEDAGWKTSWGHDVCPDCL